MKIELMKISVRGLELLNLKFKTRKHNVCGYNDYLGDLTAKLCWNEKKSDETLFSFSPLTSALCVKLRKRYVTLVVELSMELTKGSFDIGLHWNLMQDDDRQNLN